MQRIEGLYIGPSAHEGRGVFTSVDIPEGSMIEICPVIVLPIEELEIIHGTKLHDYYFLWGEAQNQCAIALGYGSLYNHFCPSNAHYLLDLDNDTIDIVSIRDIKAGEEIMVNYNGDPFDDNPVWFMKSKDQQRKTN